MNRLTPYQRDRQDADTKASGSPATRSTLHTEPHPRRVAARSLHSALTLVCLTLLVAMPASAQSPSPPPPISYRTIHAPLDQIEQMAEGEYRTISRVEFQRLIQQHQQSLPSELQRGALLSSATYAAHLEANRLLVGYANWQVISLASQPTWLDLAVPNLALTDPRWIDVAEGSRVADVGCRADGRWLLQVPQSGTVQSRWTLTAESRDDNEIHFRLRLPSSAQNRLELQIPVEYQLSVQPGVSRRIQLNEDPAAIASGSPVAPPINIWRVDLGGHSECELVLRRGDLTSTPADLQQHASYAISEEGLELTSELILTSPFEGLRQLRLRVEPPLRMAKATSNSQVLDWSQQADEAGDEYLSLLLPESNASVTRVIRLTAMAPPPDQRRWPLPRIQVDGATWQQETARIRLAQPLTLDELSMHRAMQFQPERDETDPSAQTFAVRYLDPTGRITVQLASPVPALQSSAATSIEADPTELRATMIVDLRSPGPDRFECSARLGDRWNVESVEAEDGSRLDTWQVAANPNASRQLQLRWQEPLPKDNWLRLRITARSPLTLDSQPLDLGSLLPVEWTIGTEETRQFLSIEPTTGVGMDLENDGEMTWLHVNEIEDPREASLVEATRADHLILLDSRSRRQSVVFRQQSDPARLSATRNQIHLQFSGSTLREQWRIEIDQVTRPPRQIHVQLSERREGEVRWYLEQAPQRELNARRLSNDDPVSRMETWEIDWPETGAESVVLIGERVTPALNTGSSPVALLRVLEAEAQEGTVLIDAASDLQLDLTTSPLLTSLPAGHLSMRQTGLRRYAFRYSPLAEIFADENRLRVRVARRNAPLIVWKVNAETFVDTGAVVTEQLTVLPENFGADTISVRLPAQGTVRQARVNGADSNFTLSKDGTVTIPLPPQERFPTIVLRYEVPSQLGAYGGNLQRELPQFSVPVFQRQWRCWFAPALRVQPLVQVVDERLRSQGVERGAEDSDTPWSRLFGSLIANQLTNRTPTRVQANSSDAAVEGEFRAATQRWLEWFGSTEHRQWRDLRRSEVSAPTATAGETTGTRGATSRPVDGADVWLDLPRLASLGITPETALPASQHASAIERGLERLQRSQLVLLETNDGLVVTAASSLAGIAYPVASQDRWPVVHWPHSHIMLLEQGATMVQAPWMSLYRLSQWPSLASVWSTSADETWPYAAAGWEWMDIPADGEAIWMERRSFQDVARVAIGIASIGFVTLLRRSRARWAGIVTLVWLLASGWITLHANAPWWAWAQPALWGGWAALGWHALRWRWLRAQRATTSATQSSSNATAGLATTTTALVMTLTLSLASSPSIAQSVAPRTEDTKSAKDVFDVFVPSDDQGKPTGDDVLIPRELMRRLQQSTNEDSRTSPIWLIASAEYQGALQRQDTTGTLQLDRLVAKYELHVTQGFVPIRFPIHPAAANVLELEARLDGRLIEIPWNATESAVQLPPIAAGRHELEVTFIPRTEVNADRSTIQLPIPRAAVATLSLNSPIDLATLTVPSAIGTISKRETTGQLRAELGATDQLTIQWQSPTEEAARTVIDQVCWMDLNADQVTLQVQLRVDSKRFTAPTIVLETDDRLQLDLARSPQPVAVTRSEEAGVRRLEFRVPETSNDSVIIPLHFVLNQFSGVGRVPMPLVRVQASGVARWLAVAADARLALRVDPGNGLPFPPSEFRQRFAMEKLPNYAYQFPTEPRGWSCQGQPLTSLPQIDVQTAYIIGQTTTRTLAAATVRSLSSPCFQMRIQVPEDMEIRSVQRLSAANGSNVRWSRPTPDQLTVFFEPAQTGTFQLGLVGHQAGQPLGPRNLPHLRWLDGTVSSDQRSVYRQTDVVLPDAGVPSTAASPAAIPELSPFIRNQLGLSRSWLHWQESDATAPREIDVQPNARRLKADLLNVVSRRDGIWYHRLEVRLQLESGVLDDLTLEIPESWTADLQDDASARILYSQSPRPGMRRATIWPQTQPMDASIPVVLQGQIPVRPGEPLTVPQLRLLENAEKTQRLYLPAEMDGQAILWSLSGLEPLDEPPPASLATETKATYRGFRVTSESMRATRLPTRSAIGQPSISLADLHVACLPTGQPGPARQGETSYEVFALLNLQPDGVSEVWLELPSSIDLQLITVDEQALDVSRLKKIEQAGVLQWQLPVSSSTLPQQIRVVYRGRTVPARATPFVSFAAPRLRISPATSSEVPAMTTLWTLHDLSGMRGRWVGDDSVTSSVERLQETRLAELGNIFQRATQLTTDYTGPDLARWYSVWGERFLVAIQNERTRLRQRVASEHSPAARAEAALNERVAEHRERVTQLKVEADYERMLAQLNLASADRVWLDALPPTHRIWYGQSNDPTLELRLRWDAESTGRNGWIAASLLVIVAALCVRPWKW